MPKRALSIISLFDSSGSIIKPLTNDIPKRAAPQLPTESKEKRCAISFLPFGSGWGADFFHNVVVAERNNVASGRTKKRAFSVWVVMRRRQVFPNSSQNRKRGTKKSRKRGALSSDLRVPSSRTRNDFEKEAIASSRHTTTNRVEGILNRVF